MSDSTIEERIDAVRQLMRFFRPERIAYLTVAIIAVGMILYCAVQLIQKDPSPSSLAGLFGSGGLISLGMGRLLTMWTQAMRLIAGEKLGG
jgi:hypothetical protein